MRAVRGDDAPLAAGAHDETTPTVNLLPILMALRVRGRAKTDALARATGTTIADVGACVVEAAAAGLIDGDANGFVLTPAGRAALATALTSEARDRVALAKLHDAFLAVDARLKAAVTAWQVGGSGPVSGAPDAGESSARLAAVAAVATGAAAIADRLAGVVPRLAPYARRLAAAADALARGDSRFVASPRVDSLHQVWFELHEDLLVTLGRERGA